MDLRNIGSQKYRVSEILGIRNIRYQKYQDQISSKVIIYVYIIVYYCLTKPRYVFDFRSLDQSRSKNMYFYQLLGGSLMAILTAGLFQLSRHYSSWEGHYTEVNIKQNTNKNCNVSIRGPQINKIKKIYISFILLRVKK